MDRRAREGSNLRPRTLEPRRVIDVTDLDSNRRTETHEHEPARKIRVRSIFHGTTGYMDLVALRVHAVDDVLQLLRRQIGASARW